MSSPYRDAGEALRGRAEALDRQIAEAEGRYTPAFWQALAPSLDLAAPTPLAPPPAQASPEELMSAVEEREERLAALQRLEADFARVEALWGTPAREPPAFEFRPDSVNVRLNAPFWGADPGMARFCAAVEAILPEAEVEPVDRFRLGVRAYHLGAPVSLCYQSWSHQRATHWVPLQSFTTTVARGLAPLQVRPQGIGDELLLALHLRKEIELGDQRFDGIFLVRGEDRTARALLGDEVRAALLRLALNDVPTLSVGAGRARLTWTFELSPADLETVLTALSRLHRSPPTLPLREAADQS